MDPRVEAARLLLGAAQSQSDPEKEVLFIVMAVKRHLDAIDKDLQGLRAELQTQNGDEND